MVEQVKTKTEPYVRFRGFDDEWEEVKLGDVAKISTGKLDANVMDEDGMYDFYTSGMQKYKTNTYSFEGPAITIAGNGATVGYMHYADGKFDAYQRTYVLEDFLVDRSFIYSNISRGLPRKIQREARMGNIPYIVMSMLTDLKLGSPSLPEQQKIGELFQTLDKAIDLSNTQVENLKQQKKALLQRLFPQKGETEPKVRLRGFTDEWEEVTLGDVLNKGNKNRVDDPNDYNRLTVKLNKKGLEEFVSERELANTRPFYQRFKGEIIIGKQNYFNGSIAIVTDEFDGFVSSNAIMSFSVKNDMATTAFIYFLISQDDFIKQREHFANGTGQKELSESDFLNFKLNLPSLPEQQAIGELFQTLDEQISQAEDKVSQYKELKQALLQRLFV